MPPIQPVSPTAVAVGAGTSKSQHPDPPPISPLAKPSSPVATPESQTARRVARKLQKKRRDGEHTPTMELPECLRKNDDNVDDDEEVLRPQGYGGGMFMNMNQSIFGLIAAAGSQADFTDRFEGQSSDDDDDEGGSHHMAMTIAGPRGLQPKRSETLAPHLAQTTVLRKHVASNNKVEGRHRRKISESRLLRSVPGLSRLSDKVKSSKSPRTKPLAEEGTMPASDDATELSSPPSDLAPSIEITRTESRTTAPVMSRMLEARAEMASRPSFDLDRLSGEHSRGADSGETGPTELAKRLRAIFEFDSPEEVIEGKIPALLAFLRETDLEFLEYPCWLLQHVLLQGYMYITTRHIAFYAYLPKKAVGSCQDYIVLCPSVLTGISE